ncbi:mercuric reductase [Pseudanabaena sp. lw0831]|uniref:NAD-binding protein n=1 Tax=Pseudanabaena sp. lw0831 TaxID=1357935 RepID=UPI001916AED5|nr:NAD-binding protein [Pseudanabaena sp. lw0831]GBO53561.1 mercuric reductase [Pseudanabaena sp. lw0831]
MSVDYDLVVIGMSAHAHKLVSLVALREARVAWVWDHQVKDAYLNIAQIDHILLLLKNKIGDRPKSERLQIFAQQISLIRDNYCQAEMLEILKKNGVDVIAGECKFQGKVQNSHILEVRENSLPERSRAFSQRSLSSRAYAIAHDITPLRKIFGLAEHNYLTANQFLNLEYLPKSIAVLGDDSNACAIAQAINFLGVHTSLITDHPHILPNVDVAIARTLQAQLEAEGIEVYTNTQTTAVSQIEHSRTRIWLDNQTIDCDRLLVTLAPREFYFPIDRHIYQCHGDQDIAKIMQQTLQTGFWRSVSIPQVPPMIDVSTTPTVAQIGMTELLAKQKYGQALYILESSTENSLCKIICDHKGQILGASMFGDRAKLEIEAIAIAMQGKVKIQNIAVLQEFQIAEQWEKLHRDRRQQAKFKNWFTFRRDWNI